MQEAKRRITGQSRDMECSCLGDAASHGRAATAGGGQELVKSALKVILDAYGVAYGVAYGTR